MTFPTYSVGTITETVGSVVHHKPKMPNTVDAGDLLVAVAGFSKEFAAGDFTTLPSGWGIKFVLGWTETAPRHQPITLAIFTKDAAGSEDGKTFTFDTSSQAFSSWVVHRVTGAAASFVGSAVAATELVALAPECPTDAVAASRGSQDYLIMSAYARGSATWLAAMTPPPGYDLGKHAEASGGELQSATAFRQFTGSQCNPSSGTTVFWNNATSPSESWATSQVQIAFSTFV